MMIHNLMPFECHLKLTLYTSRYFWDIIENNVDDEQILHDEYINKIAHSEKKNKVEASAPSKRRYITH